MHADARRVLAVATGSASQLGMSAAAGLITTLLLPVADRGRYVLLVTVVGVTAPLLGLGSNVGLRRERPTHDSPAALERAYLRITLVSALLHGLMAAPLLLVVTNRQIPKGWAEVTAIFFLAVTQVMSWQYVELWFSRLAFRTGAIYASLNSGSALLAAGWALVNPSFAQVVAAQALLGSILQTVQTIHIIRGQMDSSDALPTQRLWPLARGMVKLGAPSLVMTAGMSLTFRLDRLILGSLAGPQAVAVYALAGSFSELPRFIPASFGQIANGKAATQRRRLGLRPYFVPAFALTTLAAGGAGLVGYAFVHFANHAYRSALPPMTVLLFAELALVPYSIVIRMILGAGRIRLSAAVGLVAIALSCVIYWFAVSGFAIMGAAWASLAVYAFVSVTCLEIHRHQREPV